MVNFTEINNKTNIDSEKKYNNIFTKQGKIIENNKKNINKTIPIDTITVSKEISSKKQNYFKEGFHNFTFSPPSQITIDNQIDDSETEIKKTNKLITNSKEILENPIMSDVQKVYDDQLFSFEEKSNKLIENTNNYIGNHTNKDKNVYVNRLSDNNNAEFMDLYNYNSSGSNMTNIGKLNYESCKNKASLLGKTYFGLSNFINNVADCIVGDNNSNYSKDGLFQPNCTKSTDGYMYGGWLGNAIYSLENDVPVYKGCYHDDANRTMIPNGTVDPNFQNVYFAGKYGVGPWGNLGGDFPDPESDWIWYTPDADKDAPVNEESVMIFGVYWNPTDNIINSQIWGTCDNYCQLTINNVSTDITGKNMDFWLNMSTSNLGFVVSFNPGPNYVVANVKNMGGPAGLILSFVDVNNSNILFRTNTNWVYNLKESTYIPPGSQSFSVKSCGDYALKTGFKYFGVQNIINNNPNSAQCFVSNNFDEASKLGLFDGSINYEGNIYGNNNVNAIYKFTEKRYPENMGKVGYINDSGELQVYPNTMIKEGNTYSILKGYDSQGSDIASYEKIPLETCMKNCDNNSLCAGFYYGNDTNNCYLKDKNMYGPTNLNGRLDILNAGSLYMKNPGVDNNDSCPKTLDTITAVDWNNLKKSNVEMDKNNTCRLEKANETLLKEKDEAESSLNWITKLFINNINELSKTTTTMTTQMAVNSDTAENDMSLYNKIKKKYNEIMKYDYSNFNNILENSNMIVLQTRQSYIVWVILAIIFIIIFIIIVRRL